MAATIVRSIQLTVFAAGYGGNRINCYSNALAQITILCTDCGRLGTMLFRIRSSQRMTEFAPTRTCPALVDEMGLLARGSAAKTVCVIASPAGEFICHFFEALQVSFLNARFPCLSPGLAGAIVLPLMTVIFCPV